jgi:hypothetical protein
MRGAATLIALVVGIAAPSAAQLPTHAVVEVWASGASSPVASITEPLVGHCGYTDSGGTVTTADPTEVTFDDPLEAGSRCRIRRPAVPVGTYTVRVAIEGPTGRSQPTTSTAFSVSVGGSEPPPVDPPPPPPPPPPQDECVFAITPTTAIVPAAGASGVIAVNATAGCAWTGGSSASFVTLQPTTGTGPGTVTITVAANPGAVRTAILMIAGQTFNLTQSAAVVTPPPPPPPSATCVFEGKTYQQGDGLTQPLIANMSSATFERRLAALEDAGFVLKPGTGRTQHQASNDSRGGYWWIVARCRK